MLKTHNNGLLVVGRVGVLPRILLHYVPEIRATRTLGVRVQAKPGDERRIEVVARSGQQRLEGLGNVQIRRVGADLQCQDGSLDQTIARIGVLLGGFLEVSQSPRAVEDNSIMEDLRLDEQPLDGEVRQLLVPGGIRVDDTELGRERRRQFLELLIYREYVVVVH